MNQLNFNPFYIEEVKRQHEELIKEAALMRQVKEAQEGENPNIKKGLNLMAVLGRELSRIGFSLEMRYGGQLEGHAVLNQQGNSGDCA